VQEFVAVAAFGFQGVPEGMAEIEQGAGACLALIGSDDAGLGGA